MNFVQIRPFLEDKKKLLFLMKMFKTCVFCVTKLVFLPKNGPTWWTSPRLVSPESPPPKRDTTFVVIWSYFLHEKSQKVNKIDDFQLLCDDQLFQYVHAQFTFENPHILQKSHQL